MAAQITSSFTGICSITRYKHRICVTYAYSADLVALLSLSFWCLVIVVWLFLAVPWVCLQFVIVVFPDHTHLLVLIQTPHHAVIFSVCLQHVLFKIWVKIKKNQTLEMG